MSAPSTSGLHIRRAVPEDASGIAAVLAAVVAERVHSAMIERWSALESMAHVGQVGTFLLANQRGRGVGDDLWTATASFARQAGYRKLVIQVRATNIRAQHFYRRIGFEECGRLTRQVVIDGLQDDEILMELLL